MALEAYSGVWVFAEQRNGKLQEVGFELLGEGRKLADRLGCELAAVVLGYRLEPYTQELIACGADKVYVADSPVLEFYRSEPYTRLLERAVAQHRPEVFLLGATAMGTDLAPGLAARLRTGLTADCIDLDIDEQGRLVQIVPAFGGNLMAKVLCPHHRPQMATVRPGVMIEPNGERRSGEIIRLDVVEGDECSAVKVVEIQADRERKRAGLEKAEVVVAGGWGVGSSENWKLVVRLAEALAGAVGATRPAVDEGWASEEQMIGQSGVVVHPQLFIAMGISGAIQHVVGIRDSRVIVAINKDPQAPIFREADIGLVGDLRQIVPHLIEEIGKRHTTR